MDIVFIILVAIFAVALVIWLRLLFRCGRKQEHLIEKSNADLDSVCMNVMKQESTELKTGRELNWKSKTYQIY